MEYCRTPVSASSRTTSPSLDANVPILSPVASNLFPSAGQENACLSPLNQFQACRTPVSQPSAVPSPHSACNLENCSVCLSPLCQGNFASARGEIFTTECNHQFHKSCLVKLREFEQQGRCPMCRQQLPAGLTPPDVRVLRERAALVDAHTTFRNQATHAIRSRTATARAAVIMANRRRAEEREAAERAAPRDASPPLVVVGSQATPEDEDEAIAEEGLAGPSTPMVLAEVVAGPGLAGGECCHCESRKAERSCQGCAAGFCSLCSTTDYSQREERDYCLDCQRVRAPAPSASIEGV